MRFHLPLVLIGAALLLAGCERPPVDAVQRGYRGLGMEQVYNPRTLAEQIPLNQLPAAVDPGTMDGPTAGQILQNVQVLGDLPIGHFTALMTAMTAWVSPKEGCAYCHNLENLADDSKYTKVVARKMIQMTQKVNAGWQPHVAATGVTCYTCHRGQPVPTYSWTQPVAQDKRSDFIGNLNGQNLGSPTVGLAALPADPVTTYLVKPVNIRVGGPAALPTDHVQSIQNTEGTYALMFHISGALGVNCTYCHNSRSFGEWTESPPQRTTAWHGINMVRNLNTEYMLPLAGTWPKNRLGPNGDAPLVACATCHQGAYKPLYGASMIKEWPGLQGAGAKLSVAAVEPSTTPVEVNPK